MKCQFEQIVLSTVADDERELKTPSTTTDRRKQFLYEPVSADPALRTPRCRLFVGVAKSGTTWLMNLMYQYLLLLLKAKDLNPASMSLSNGHVKRVQYSCQYEWGDRVRGDDDFPPDDPQQFLAFRLLPAFSHVHRNHGVRGPADTLTDDELNHFKRFFDMVRPPASAQRTLLESLRDQNQTSSDQVNRALRDLTGHKRPSNRVSSSLFSVVPVPVDKRCSLFVHLREPMTQAFSACQYYPNVCQDKDALRMVPSASRQSLMQPLNATLRWSQYMDTVLRQLDAPFWSPGFPTAAPSPPHYYTQQCPRTSSLSSHSRHRLSITKVHFGTYERFVRDPAAGLATLIQFFDFPVDHDLVRQSVRLVAARMANLSLKTDVSKAHVSDVLTDDQKNYIQRLSFQVDPFYSAVPTVPLPPPPAADAAASDHFRGLQHWSAESALAKYNECVDADNSVHNGTLLFENDECHAAWEVMVMSQPVDSVLAVKPIVDDEHPGILSNDNGVVHVRLQAGTRATLKVCDGVRSLETWKAEIVAHAVDRLLQLNRVPAVVPRFVALDSVPLFDRTQVNASTARLWYSQLMDIQLLCQQERAVFAGSMAGWTTRPLTSVGHIHQPFLRRFPRVSLTEMRPSFVEFSRLMLGLFMTGNPHKLDHNVFAIPGSLDALKQLRGNSAAGGQRGELFDSRPAKHNDRMFLVSADNDRARWLDPYRPSVNVTAVCNRTTASVAEFQCAGFQQVRLPSADHVQSFLQSSCVFPRAVGLRVLHLARDQATRPFSQRVQLFVLEQMQAAVKHSGTGLLFNPEGMQWHLSPFSMTRMRVPVLDNYFNTLVDLIQNCSAKFGGQSQIFF